MPSGARCRTTLSPASSHWSTRRSSRTRAPLHRDGIAPRSLRDHGRNRAGWANEKRPDHRCPRAEPCAGTSDSLDGEAQTASRPLLPFHSSIEIMTFSETQPLIAKCFDTQLSFLTVRLRVKASCFFPDPSVFPVCDDARLRHGIPAVGVGLNGCGRIHRQLVHARRHLVPQFSIWSNEISLPVCAAMRPIEVTRLASTPRFTSL